MNPDDLEMPKLDRKFWVSFVAALFDLFLSLCSIAVALGIWLLAFVVIVAGASIVWFGGNAIVSFIGGLFA